MTIRLAFTGRGYHTAHDWPTHLELAPGTTVAAALRDLQSRLPQPLPASCLVIVSGRHVGTVGQCLTTGSDVLEEGDELLLLAPVAGG